MNTEDKFYFGKHGQPERFERRMTSQELGHLRNWISNHARNTDEAVSAMGKMQRIFEDDPEFWEDKGWSAVARAANVLAFSRPGQPERFGYSYRPTNIQAADLDYAISEIQKDMKHMTQVMQKAIKKNPLDTGWIWDTDSTHNLLLNFIDEAKGVLKHKDSQVQAKAKKAVGEVRAFLDKWEKMQARSRSGKAPFSRPGQPEKFGAIEEAAKIRISDIQSGNEQQLNKIEPILQAAANMGDERAARYLKMLRFERKHLETSVPQAPWHRSSRPGQPERFDASSLDRKGFAAASSSPMLGKLLSEKQMPEGGWRAVETGGGALVISFEDGDVAGNFARRVASHGYSATAPVQSIGRYWNVEVKNGK